MAAAAAAPPMQAARFVTGGSAWSEQDDEALLAQRRASAGTGAFFPERVLPQLPDSERLLTGPVRLLDVGVGVAAMAVALCQHMPQLSIVGLDVLDRPLELARLHVEEAGLDERIELRRLDVAELDAADEFDLAWLPAPFIPQPALERGVAGSLPPCGQTAGCCWATGAWVTTPWTRWSPGSRRWPTAARPWKTARPRPCWRASGWWTCTTCSRPRARPPSRWAAAAHSREGAALRRTLGGLATRVRHERGAPETRCSVIGGAGAQ